MTAGLHPRDEDLSPGTPGLEAGAACLRISSNAAVGDAVGLSTSLRV